MKTVRLTLVAAMAGAVALAGCTDVNSPTADPNQRTKEGAAIGAATGVIIGLAGTKGNNKAGRRRAALLGGIAGAAAGGAIGNNLDKQAAALRSSISDSRVQIINTGSQLIVRMPNDILFPFDSSTVAPSLNGDLRALANNLQSYPGSTVQVIGHTDSTGDATYNQSLSVARARAVANILIADGVSSNRVRTIGRGEDDPVASNLTPEGRAQNRRVDIVIIPNG